MSTPFLSVAQLARQAGVTRQAVRLAIKEGRLPAQLVAAEPPESPYYRITPADAAAWLQRRAGEVDQTPTLSLAETAHALGRSRSNIYVYVRTGKLPAHKVGGHWRVRLPDADAFFRKLHPLGPPNAMIPCNNVPERLREQRRAEQVAAGEARKALRALERMGRPESRVVATFRAVMIKPAP